MKRQKKTERIAGVVVTEKTRALFLAIRALDGLGYVERREVLKAIRGYFGIPLEDLASP